MKFLIQTYNSEIEHDFSFMLIQHIKSHNDFSYSWDKIEYILSNEIINDKDLIPVGSVEFVSKFYKEVHSIDNIKAINIPDSLNKNEFLGRKIFKNLDKESIINNVMGLDEFVVKSQNTYKGFPLSQYLLPDDLDMINIDLKDNIQYQVSELINILSEWRAFVFNGKLLDIKNYSGSPFIFPSVKAIEFMIEEFEIDNKIPAYTIDIAINHHENTVLLEMHHIYSCGLYGFSSEKLIYMYSQCHHQILRNKS